MELSDPINFARGDRWSVLTDGRAVVRLRPGRAYGRFSLPRRGGAEQE